MGLWDIEGACTAPACSVVPGFGPCWRKFLQIPGRACGLRALCIPSQGASEIYFFGQASENPGNKPRWGSGPDRRPRTVDPGIPLQLTKESMVPLPLSLARQEALRLELPFIADLLRARRASEISEAAIEDLVSLCWLEWFGGKLKLTQTGTNICQQQRGAGSRSTDW